MPIGIYKHPIQCGFQKGHKINIGRPSWSKGKKLPQFSGKNANGWKGGKRKRKDGYIIIYQPSHPFCNEGVYVRRCRLVVEKYLGRYLTRKEIVHHINEKVDDDRIENLMVFENRSYHMWFHKKNGNYNNGIIFDGRNILNNSLPPTLSIT